MYDVVIVGSGPSGSTAGYHLAKSGLRVALIDKSYFPRAKACGDGISIKAVRQLDFDYPERLIHRKLVGSSIISSNNELFTGRVNRVIGITTPRYDFDHFLVKKAVDAGVELFQGLRIDSMSMNENNCVVSGGEKKFRSKFLIGADGSNTTIGKLTGLKRKLSPTEYGFAMRGYIDFSDYEMKKFLFSSKMLELYFYPIPFGYGWIFPMKSSINVGIGGVASKIRPIKKYFRDFVNRVFKIRNMKMRKAHSIRGRKLIPGGFPMQYAKGRTLLVGDAAGLLDPFSGEGIRWAIKSGQIASNLIIEIQEGEKEEDLVKIYQRIISEEIGKNLKYARLATYKIYNNLEKFFEILKYNPQAIFYFVNLAEGFDSYVSLLKRIVLWKSWIMSARVILGKLGLIKPDSSMYYKDFSKYFY